MKKEKQEITVQKSDSVYFPAVPDIIAPDGTCLIIFDDEGNITYIPKSLVMEFLEYFRKTEAAISAVTLPP